MAIELKSVTNEKYMCTDIDSIVLFFDESGKESFDSEFEIPEKYKYMVMISERDDLDYPVWIEIINPSAVTDESPLPAIGTIIFENRNMDLRSIIKELA